jgi:hypothetical protein
LPASIDVSCDTAVAAERTQISHRSVTIEECV